MSIEQAFALAEKEIRCGHKGRAMLLINHALVSGTYVPEVHDARLAQLMKDMPKSDLTTKGERLREVLK
jgi:hypothetical protein